MSVGQAAVDTGWGVMARTGRVGCLFCVLQLLAPAVLLAQTEVPDQVRATRRSALLMARLNRVPAARPTTSVVGSVWSPQNEGVPDIAVRLRDIQSGEIWAATRTDEAGDFAFEQVSSATYLLEVAETEDGSPVALGDMFTVSPGETVAIFVKMPAPPGWGSTLAALLGAPAGASGAAVGSAVGSTVGSAVGAGVGAVGSGLASTFGTAVASVVSSAASAGVTGIGGGIAASNDYAAAVQLPAAQLTEGRQ